MNERTGEISELKRVIEETIKTQKPAEIPESIVLRLNWQKHLDEYADLNTQRLRSKSSFRASMGNFSLISKRNAQQQEQLLQQPNNNNVL